MGANRWPQSGPRPGAHPSFTLVHEPASGQHAAGPALPWPPHCAHMSTCAPSCARVCTGTRASLNPVDHSQLRTGAWSSSALTCCVHPLLLGLPWVGCSAHDSGHSDGASKAQRTRSGLLQGKSLTSAVAPEHTVSSAAQASLPFLLLGSPGHHGAPLAAAPAASTHAEGSAELRCSPSHAAASHALSLGGDSCRQGKGGHAGCQRCTPRGNPNHACKPARGAEPLVGP